MISWPAPAKLNLFLHITGQRPDGYHSLQTVFQFLDYSDELTFADTDDGEISRALPVPGVTEEADLCVRAARLLQTAAGVTQGVRIQLHKRLPLGGGLGGGSSDAATTLLALNELWRLNWPLNELAALGLKLGADIPVFIHGHAAWAEGIGEILTPMEPVSTWYVVIVPPVAVSTARVFTAFADAGRERQLTHHSPAITIRDFHAGRAHNDLAPVVRRLYPEVDKALKWLSSFGAAKMTGSGACVFLAVASLDQGHAVLSALRISGLASYTGFVAQGINIHPIHARQGGGMNWGVAKR